MTTLVISAIRQFPTARGEAALHFSNIAATSATAAVIARRLARGKGKDTASPNSSSSHRYILGISQHKRIVKAIRQIQANSSKASSNTYPKTVR